MNIVFLLKKKKDFIQVEVNVAGIAIHTWVYMCEIYFTLKILPSKSHAQRCCCGLTQSGVAQEFGSTKLAYSLIIVVLYDYTFNKLQ